MAREEWEETEEEDIDLVTEFKRSIADMRKKREKYDMTSPEYANLTKLIIDETESLKMLQAAENEKAQSDTARSNRYTGLIQAVGNMVGNFGGQLVTSMINRKNVKSVIGYEDDGGIVNSKAVKFIK